MKHIYKNNTGYSVLISLFIIGFLIVLTTGVFNLVLNELRDNRSMGNYIKSYAGAEGAQELALLKIKEEGYGYDNGSFTGVLLSSESIEFNRVKDTAISYELGTKTGLYASSLLPLQYAIIPLFYYDEDHPDEVKTPKIFLTTISEDLVWNIIAEDSGISGLGSIGAGTTGKQRGLSGQDFTFNTTSVHDFISANSNNYVMLFNSGDTEIEYELNTGGNGYFSKPKTEIISSAQVGNIKQNLRTTLDNTEYLNILKYAIYSNDNN